MNSAFAFKCLSAACLAKEAERDMSSYEELVQEPINATSNLSGQLFVFTASANLLMGQAKTGVKGPFTYGSHSLRFISMSSS